MTDIETLKRGGRFSWGDIICYHHIGEYDIVEFHPWVYVNCCSTQQVNTNKTEFECFINGVSISKQTSSLDEALAVCIAYKHGGCNSQAAFFFMKMVKGETKE